MRQEYNELGEEVLYEIKSEKWAGSDHVGLMGKMCRF